MRSLSLIGLLLLSLIAAGCKNGEFGLKRWGGSPYGQGDVERQKARAATAFDPYPMNDIGPEIVGARPRGFTQPLSEPMRDQLNARPMTNPWSQYR
jgi:hypothetical protein